MPQISILLQLVEEMPEIKRETCLDFVHFRNVLKAHRSKCDDKIRQRLSSITNPNDQCKKFGDNLRRAQESRIKNLKLCINVLSEELSASDHVDSVLKKEVFGHLFKRVIYDLVERFIGIRNNCRRNCLRTE